MELWIATHNDGKLREIKNLTQDFNIVIHSQKELTYYSPPKETGNTFEENARLKAKSLKAIKPEHWIIGEDSGLVVEALNNYPGVYSSRYAGENASDAENIAKLLKMLQIRSTNHRNAYFQTALIAYSPEGKEFLFEGKIEGTIAKAPQGKIGFGYDPIFIPQGEEKTFAELGLAYKNQHSHRAKAIKVFIDFFKTTL